MKKEEDVVVTLIEFLNALNNENRKKILRITYNNPKSISQLARDIGTSQKVAWKHVEVLSKVGFVELEKKEREKHRPVYVTAVVKPEWYDKLFKALTHDIKRSLNNIELANRIKAVSDSKGKAKGKELDMLGKRLDKLK